VFALYSARLKLFFFCDEHVLFCHSGAPYGGDSVR
jgi:hypothetical protein